MSQTSSLAADKSKVPPGGVSPPSEQPGIYPCSDRFVRRQIGPSDADIQQMLAVCGFPSLDALIEAAVPAQIRLRRPLNLPPSRSEHGLLNELREIAARNQIFRSFIGAGYFDCITPPIIQRGILENPGWYTPYTPYQAEISQGRLETLLNFQTMITDLTGMEIANASLLDEATAAAEAMTMCWGLKGRKKDFFVSETCHPQTIEVVRTRAKALGLEVIAGNHHDFDFGRGVFAVLAQYPATDGTICDYRKFIETAHQHEALAIVAADLLSLTLLTPPGEFGADCAVGSSQRFGVPMGYGGPHAAYFATRQDYVRHMPGRIIGVSIDAQGNRALRMALQTREQHIRREKATSNICTAQALLAIIAGAYAVWHGPKGLKAIAQHVHGLTAQLARGLAKLGFKLRHENFFDTVAVQVERAQVDQILSAAEAREMNFRRLDEHGIGISLDETTTPDDVRDILGAFGKPGPAEPETLRLPPALLRKSAWLTHPVFNTHHSETEMLRYLRLLESRDLSLTRSMIPLGSCTVKLNAAAEMLPITWPPFGRLHPFAPRAQAAGYTQIFQELEAMLAEITGFPGVSLQPNSGAQGEYAGLQVIKAFHESRGEGHRKVCLIPQSAHGTNPASAAMVNYKIVVIKTDEFGNVDVTDLEKRAAEHAQDLAAL